MIDTAVPGRPDQVRAAAEWLRSLWAATAGSRRLLVEARATAGAGWRGSSAEAYAAASQRVLGAADCYEADLARAAGLLGEYADRLAALQAHMAEVRARAAAAGLAVHGAVVPPPHDPLQLAVWTELGQEVARARADLQTWVGGRLAPEAGRARDGLAWLRNALEDSAAPVLTTSGTVLGTRLLGRMAERMTTLGADAQRRAEDLRGAARSGNPARRHAAAAPQARAERRALGRVASDAAGLADNARRAARVLGPVGTAIDVVVAADKIRDGASPSETVVATAAGTVAAAATAAALTPALPLLATAAAAGGVALGASTAVGWGWRSLPEELTGEVDETLREGWGAAGDLAGDAWDLVADGWDRGR